MGQIISLETYCSCVLLACSTIIFARGMGLHCSAFINGNPPQKRMDSHATTVSERFLLEFCSPRPTQLALGSA